MYDDIYELLHEAIWKEWFLKSLRCFHIICRFMAFIAWAKHTCDMWNFTLMRCYGGIHPKSITRNPKKSVWTAMPIVCFMRFFFLLWIYFFWKFFSFSKLSKHWNCVWHLFHPFFAGILFIAGKIKAFRSIKRIFFMFYMRELVNSMRFWD